MTESSFTRVTSDDAGTETDLPGEEHDKDEEAEPPVKRCRRILRQTFSAESSASASSTASSLFDALCRNRVRCFLTPRTLQQTPFSHLIDISIIRISDLFSQLTILGHTGAFD